MQCAIGGALRLPPAECARRAPQIVSEIFPCREAPSAHHAGGATGPSREVRPRLLPRLRRCEHRRARSERDSEC